MYQGNKPEGQEPDADDMTNDPTNVAVQPGHTPALGDAVRHAAKPSRGAEDSHYNRDAKNTVQPPAKSNQIQHPQK